MGRTRSTYHRRDKKPGFESSTIRIYWLNLKNCFTPEIGLVTVFWPFTTNGGGRLVVQTGEPRFVVDCSVKLVKLVGQDTMTVAAEGVIFSCGRVTANEMLNIVPLPPLPP